MTTDPDLDLEMLVSDASPADIADGLATDAALAHATAVGVYEVIDRLRYSDPGHPIPAPGTVDLPDRIGAYAVDAIHAAAAAHDAADERVAWHALERAHAALAAARRALARLATVGLGVAQHAVGGDDVELAERAMVAVLFAPDGAGAEPHADGIVDVALVGSTRPEVSVELAGILARSVIEQSLDPATPLHLVVGSRGIEPVVLTVAPDGVRVDDDAFPAPVAIVEVTVAVLSRVAAVDPTAVTRMTVRTRTRKETP